MSSGGVRLQMEMIEGWNGASACMLQAALRMSNEAFAAHLGISVRTVAGWHQNSAMRPRPEMQQLLDTALSQERYSKPHVIEKKKSARAASNASW